MSLTDWHHCYRTTWRGELAPAAWAHPAKFAPGLVQRIYAHLALPPGARVLDPFAGVALGALEAQRRGLHWLGVELEPVFVAAGRANLALWQARYGPHLPGWGAATLLQGDSRRLAELLAGAHAVVSSPPYGGNDKRDFTVAAHDPRPQGAGCFRGSYSRTPGQLGDLPGGDFAAALASPPYNLPMSQDHNGARGGRRGLTPSEGGAFVRYGPSAGQLEGQSPATFWIAAAVILAQVYACLAPGAPAVWVVKDHVRHGRIVPFAAQWQALGEAAGFHTAHVHRAWLIDEQGAQQDIFGASHPRRVARKSFFRRLAEQRGAPALDWETVICQVRPAD